MTALIFTLATELRQRVDLSPLTPDSLAGKSIEEIGATLLQTGNRQRRADEIFVIEGNDTSHIKVQNSTAKLDYIGKGMTHGDLYVAGDAGSYAGMSMKGGNLRILGDVGAYAACEMKNGQIHVQGDAGDFLGAALPGNKKGMQGGIVIVKGNAADRVGDRMRRGAILIEGDAGCYLGARMTAGTVAVLGSVGEHIGYAMQRGTLLLLQAPSSIPVTFNDCGTHTLGFLPLLLRGFQEFETRFGALAGSIKRVQRYAGDMANLGKGEMLIAV